MTPLSLVRNGIFPLKSAPSGVVGYRESSSPPRCSQLAHSRTHSLCSRTQKEQCDLHDDRLGRPGPTAPVPMPCVVPPRAVRRADSSAPLYQEGIHQHSCSNGGAPAKHAWRYINTFAIVKDERVHFNLVRVQGSKFHWRRNFEWRSLRFIVQFKKGFLKKKMRDKNRQMTIPNTMA